MGKNTKEFRVSWWTDDAEQARGEKPHDGIFNDDFVEAEDEREAILLMMDFLAEDITSFVIGVDENGEDIYAANAEIDQDEETVKIFDEDGNIYYEYYNFIAVATEDEDEGED